MKNHATVQADVGEGEGCVAGTVLVAVAVAGRGDAVAPLAVAVAGAGVGGACVAAGVWAVWLGDGVGLAGRVAVATGLDGEGVGAGVVD